LAVIQHYLNRFVELCLKFINVMYYILFEFTNILLNIYIYIYIYIYIINTYKYLKNMQIII